MDQTEHNKVDHDTIIVDADSHFNIDIYTRAITNSENKKTSLIQYDHNSERFSFDIDRYIEGHDLMLCNQIQVHYQNKGGTSKGTTFGVYTVTDLKVHPTDNNKVYFTWLISENATHHNGALNFLISFACVKDEEILYRWNTSICSAITIIPGLNNSEAVVENYPDALLQLEYKLMNEVLPAMVDQRYVERDFATSDEVDAVFNSSSTESTT